jgi:hypothetical protein
VVRPEPVLGQRELPRQVGLDELGHARPLHTSTSIVAAHGARETNRSDDIQSCFFLIKVKTFKVDACMLHASCDS